MAGQVNSIDIQRAQGLQRLEPVALALVARFAVRALSWKQALALFDRVTLKQRTPAEGPVSMPLERDFRGAGACLARSLARSQYLRRRGAASTIVIGATTTQPSESGAVKLDAHAWLETLDSSPNHSALHRIER